MSGESREYASQRDYHSWVQAEADNRAATIARAVREAFGSVIRQETTEVVVFSDLSVPGRLNGIWVSRTSILMIPS